MLIKGTRADDVLLKFMWLYLQWWTLLKKIQEYHDLPWNVMYFSPNELPLFFLNKKPVKIIIFTCINKVSISTITDCLACGDEMETGGDRLASIVVFLVILHGRCIFCIHWGGDKIIVDNIYRCLRKLSYCNSNFTEICCQGSNMTIIQNWFW